MFVRCTFVYDDGDDYACNSELKIIIDDIYGTTDESPCGTLSSAKRKKGINKRSERKWNNTDIPLFFEYLNQLRWKKAGSAYIMQKKSAATVNYRFR